MSRKIFDLNRSCELPKLVDRVVREVEAHRSLDRLSLRHPRKARHERGDEHAIEFEGRSHDPSMPYNLADSAVGPASNNTNRSPTIVGPIIDLG